MSYTPEVSKLKMAIYTLHTHSGVGSYAQSGFSSTSWGKVNLFSFTTTYNPFQDTVTFNSSTDVITLPSGQYYFNGRLMSYDPTSPYESRWSECTFYDYVADEAVGYIGRKWQNVAYNRNPNFNEHAKAYIESDGTRQIQFRARASHSTLEVSDYQGDNAIGRVIIHRLS